MERGFAALMTWFCNKQYRYINAVIHSAQVTPPIKYNVTIVDNKIDHYSSGGMDDE
jgi:hypothetical protein